MEILVVTDQYPPSIGGMQKHCYELVKGLEKRATLHLIAYEQGSHLFFLLTAAVKVLEKLRANPRIDIIYVNSGAMACVLFPILRLVRRPLVVTIHGEDVVFPMRFYQGLLKRTLRQCAAIIAVSKETAEECKARRLGSEKVHLVKNGFATKIPQTMDEGSFVTTLEQRLGISLKGKKTLVSIGRSVPRKGFSWFIRNVFERLEGHVVYIMIGPEMQHTLAFNLMKKLLPRGLYDRICLAGGFPVDDAEVKQAIVEAGFSRRIFRVSGLSDEEVYKVLAISDLFVMPNLKIRGDFEGFGLVALEACAAGALVVASKVDGIPSAIQHEETGILLEPGETEIWVRTINELLKHPERVRRKRIEFKENLLQGDLSWDSMAERYLGVFHGVMGALTEGGIRLRNHR